MNFFSCHRPQTLSREMCCSASIQKKALLRLEYLAPFWYVIIQARSDPNADRGIPVKDPWTDIVRFHPVLDSGISRERLNLKTIWNSGPWPEIVAGTVNSTSLKGTTNRPSCTAPSRMCVPSAKSKVTTKPPRAI